MTDQTNYRTEDNENLDPWAGDPGYKARQLEEIILTGEYGEVTCRAELTEDDSGNVMYLAVVEDAEGGVITADMTLYESAPAATAAAVRIGERL